MQTKTRLLFLDKEEGKASVTDRRTDKVNLDRLSSLTKNKKTKNHSTRKKNGNWVDEYMYSVKTDKSGGPKVREHPTKTSWSYGRRK